MKSLSAVAVLAMLVAGSASAVTVTTEQLVMNGGVSQATMEYSFGTGVASCITRTLQGVSTSVDECNGTVTLDKFSDPVSNVSMVGTGYVGDVFDGAEALAFDSQGNYLGGCLADTVFDTYSQPQFAGPCSTFLGKSSSDHFAFGWSEQFSLSLPFNNIGYVAVLPMSDGHTSGAVTGYTAKSADASVTEPSTFYLFTLGLLAAVWLAMRRHYLDTRRAPHA